MRDVGRWLVPGHRRADPAGPAPAVPAAHGRPARGVLGLRGRARRRPGHAPLPGAVAVDGRGGGRRGLAAPGAAAGRQGLAAAGRGRAGRGRGRHPAGARPGPAGRRRWPRPRRRSCTATGSSTTSAPTTRGGRWCWTGSSPGAARRCPTWPGTWPSTAAACRSPRRPRSRPTGRRWRAAASTPGPGGTASWRCACSARWSSSAGRRRSAATTRSSRWWETESYGRRRCWLTTLSWRRDCA